MSEDQEPANIPVRRQIDGEWQTVLITRSEWEANEGRARLCARQECEKPMADHMGWAQGHTFVSRALGSCTPAEGQHERAESTAECEGGSTCEGHPKPQGFQMPDDLLAGLAKAITPSRIPCGQVTGILDFCDKEVNHEGECEPAPSTFERIPEGAVTLTDEVYERLRRGPEDPGEGKHLWTMACAIRVPDQMMRALVNGKDPGALLISPDSLIVMEGPGCYKCELPYTRYLYFRDCKGSMEPQDGPNA